jgi:hypothetical protein
MDLFQGTSATDKSTPPEERRTPADSILREKILLQLQRSTLASTTVLHRLLLNFHLCSSHVSDIINSHFRFFSANSFPRTLQIIFEAVFGATSPARIKRAGLSFVQAVFEKVPIHRLTVNPSFVWLVLTP